MYTMLTCPICHRMFETHVTECAVKLGGCGYVVPQAKAVKPAAPSSAPHLTPSTGLDAAPAHAPTIEEASEAASAAINALNIQGG